MYLLEARWRHVRTMLHIPVCILKARNCGAIVLNHMRLGSGGCMVEHRTVNWGDGMVVQAKNIQFRICSKCKRSSAVYNLLKI